RCGNRREASREQQAIPRRCSPRLYLQRRTAQGKTKREVIRCLKRYVAREVYRFIVAAPLPQPQPMAA
ncbi:IS110 family transposase, partial [Streptomyces minutiscleroticus]